MMRGGKERGQMPTLCIRDRPHVMDLVTEIGARPLSSLTNAVRWKKDDRIDTFSSNYIT